MKTKLFPEERYRLILSALEHKGRISVDELSQKFDISHVTIRGDLQHLADQNLLVRTHGGAIMATRSENEGAFDLRKSVHILEKQRIGAAAAASIADGEVIALDASTTALAVASHLKTRKGLTVITNSLVVAAELLDAPDVNVLVPGGFLRRDSVSLVGVSSQDFLKDYNIQKAFFGARGFSIAEGLTEVNDLESQAKREILTKTRQLIAVVDSSKLGQVSFVSFASLRQISHLITDTNAPTQFIEQVRAAEIPVTLV